MRIVHVTTLYNPFIGGLEMVVQKIAEAQARMGHEVYVVTSDVSCKKHGTEIKNNVTVIRVNSFNSKYPYFIVPIDIPERILSIADIVHGWSQTYYFVYRILKYSKKVLNKPVVLYFIGVDYLEKHYKPIIRFIGFKYQRYLTKRFAGFLDAAITTNNYERNLLKERYDIDSVVLPHGVDELYLKAPNMAREFREKYHVDRRIIAFIGRIHPTKGLDLLIKAFSVIAKEEKDFVLIIAGKGNEEYLNKCLILADKLGIKNRVIYLGYISEKDKIGLIDASEVIVLPSRHAGESYPLLIEEVRSRGKPMVVTNYGSLPFLVRDGIDGIVVKADEEFLAKGILKIIKGENKLSPGKPHTLSEIVILLEKLYRNVVR